MITWSPDPAEPLISVLSSVYPVSASVTASSEEGGASIVGYDLDADAPEQISVSYSGSILTVDVPHWEGIFPPAAIRYVIGDELVTITDWDDLPPEAREVVKFHAHSTPVYTYALTVQASSPEGMTSSETYTIEVLCDYSLGRDTLRGEVDARR